MSESFFSADGRTALEGVDASRFEGARILITGATGAVGIHVLAALRHLLSAGRNFDVHATFQNEVTGPLAELLDHTRFHQIRGDLTSPTFRAKLPKADFIFHSSGYGQPGRFLENPGKTIRLNVETTLDLLEGLPVNGRLLFVSSSEVYAGLSTAEPYREDQIGTSGPDHPRACYIEGKRCGEAACHAAFAGGVGAVSARLGLAYGPGARPGDRRALYTFIDQGIQDREIALLDNGEAVRNYCYAPDAVRMMLRIMLDGRQPVYNVGGLDSQTVRSVAEQVGRMLGVPVRLPQGARPLAGAPVRVGQDLSRFEGEFGPVLFTDFAKGLRRTIEWHQLLAGRVLQ